MVYKQSWNLLNLKLDSIPKVNEKVYLRANSNIATGGTCEDFTDKVHPSVIKICKKVLETFPGLPYAGIDFLCSDISKKQTKNSYIILEVNSIPGIKMHMYPSIGTSRNISKYIVDLMFPETKH